MRIPGYEYPKIETQVQKKALLYLRVSTEEQVGNFSLGTQEEICRREAAYRGYEITEIFRDEGKSAKTIKGRTELLRLLDYCRKNKNKVDAVFVYKFDRASRLVYDFLTIRIKLKEYGVRLISATEPSGERPMEIFSEQIAALNAELENNMRAERARNGMYARFHAGLPTKAPIGYLVVDGFAIKDPEMWDKVKSAWDLVATGTKSLSQMADIMNKWGIRARVGQRSFKLRGQVTSRIFRSKFYIGKLYSPTYKEEVRGLHNPMITEEQFNRVQVIIDGRNTNKMNLRRTRDNPNFPLRRILKCNRCRASLTGSFSRGRSGKRYPHYHCGRACTHQTARTADVEQNILDLLDTLTWNEDGLRLLKALIFKKHSQRFSLIYKLHRASEITIGRLKEQQRVLVEKNLAGIYSDDIFLEQNKFIEKRLEEAENVRNGELIEQYNSKKVEPIVDKFLDSLSKMYLEFELAQKRVLLCLVFKTAPHWSYPGLAKINLSSIFITSKDN